MPNFINEKEVFFCIEFINDSIISYSEFVESREVCGERLWRNLFKVFGELVDFGDDSVSVGGA
jgi:hypothetical protein